MTVTAQDILLGKITKLLQDLRDDGADNGEAMFLLGSAAAEIADSGDKAGWREFKASLGPADTIGLLQQIDTEGNRLIDEDKRTFAYAIQIIGMSLAAGNSDDARLQHGASLLDDIIETTLTNFRNHVRTRTTPLN
jgi:hypothetical protein